MAKRKRGEPPDRVYLIRCINEGLVQYKIGNTGRSAQARIRDMETANPGDMDVVAEFFTEYATTLETVLHKHWSPYLKKGEWFTAGANIHADEFVEVCGKYERNFGLINPRVLRFTTKPVAFDQDDTWDDLLT